MYVMDYTLGERYGSVREPRSATEIWRFGGTGVRLVTILSHPLGKWVRMNTFVTRKSGTRVHLVTNLLCAPLEFVSVLEFVSAGVLKHTIHNENKFWRGSSAAVS